MTSQISRPASIADAEEGAPVPPRLIDSAPSGHTTYNDSDIRYEYLTFETSLPHLLRPLPTNPIDNEPSAEILPPPDIRRFTSPFCWSPARKNVILVLSCTVTFLSAYSAGAYSICSVPLKAKWQISSAIIYNTGITTWATGFAISPMFLAPLSEINGRRPVFIASGVLFVLSLLGCAVTESFAGMLVARFFVGAGASTFATMVGGVVSDVYVAESRNSPMAIYSGSALAGTGVGPLISGFIVERVSWRWVFYVQVIATGVTIVAVFLFFQETRGSVLLSRKARALNEYYAKMEEAGYRVDFSPQSSGQFEDEKDASYGSGNPSTASHFRFKVAADENRSSLARMLYLSLTIPFKLLSTEPVVFFFSLWAAFAWAVLYMTFDAIPLVFSTRYGFTVSQCGSVFAAITIGTIISTILSIYQEKIAKKHWSKLTTTPEGRLYFACLESALLPVGLFWFGWTAVPQVPWIVPVLALGCAQIGIFSIYLAVFNYLADVYHRYASSALAGQSFCRNMLAAIFPLFIDAMFRNLGYPAASSLLGGVSALLTLVPWVLLFYGPRIRARSKIASEIMENGASSTG